MPWQTIITSAAVGAIISSGLMLWNSWLERRARRREALFHLAYNLAKDGTDLVLRVAEADGKPATFRDAIFSVERYFKWLLSLYQTGSLPKEAIETEQAGEARKRGIG